MKFLITLNTLSPYTLSIKGLITLKVSEECNHGNQCNQTAKKGLDYSDYADYSEITNLKPIRP